MGDKDMENLDAYLDIVEEIIDGAKYHPDLMKML
jgi:hypothetical protein